MMNASASLPDILIFHFHSLAFPRESAIREAGGFIEPITNDATRGQLIDNHFVDVRSPQVDKKHTKKSFSS
jgi:hypothetical protein